MDNVNFKEFQTKYGNLYNTQDAQFISINEIKLVIGYFNSNVIESFYLDESIKSINKDLKIRISSDVRTQYFSPNHLVRLNQLNPIKKRQNMIFNYRLDPIINPNIYLLDTGINLTIPEFKNNTRFKNKLSLRNDSNDLNGHGSSIASVIGSTLLGVCKNCNIISYQLLNYKGIGNLSSLIKILSIINDSNIAGIILMPFIMSETSSILNEILKTLSQNSHFLLIAPSGNDNLNSCNFSPSSSSHVLTVGSIDPYTDTIATFSNYGECIDIFTDGVNIITYNSANDTIFTWKSGSSLSSAIAAGLIGSYLSFYNEINYENNLDVINKIKNNSIKNKIKPLEFLQKTNTSNFILYNYLR